MTPYTLAVWRVTEGREDEFIQAWSTKLVSAFRSLERPPVWGKLLRSADDPRLFYSFGPWETVEDIAAMRADPVSAAALQRVASLCDEFTPGLFFEAASG